ncbi:alpha/beta hydrolase [Promicromonospora thailandica]|uniref:Lysophospholipase, alpha-beta hydrolase superfamily n=1 Tax=Promicromonospora thailandica TaxID=765201 RepID=A0A9X2JVN3_9MICO|nr:alpha/beta hydrolase [Promicromonospora thailandica]MCP2265246.1 Lysophospholipase, alpha-beta hydrolase superfamily [Promicromonospora thailandica]
MTSHSPDPDPAPDPDSRTAAEAGPAVGQDWEPDVLPGFERRTLPLTADEDEAEVVATLVRRFRPAVPEATEPRRGHPVGAGNPQVARLWEELAELGRRLRLPGTVRHPEATGQPEAAEPVPDAGVDLLYVHGWLDYFFQVHLAEFWESLGVRFHALDLRRYGRSLRPDQTPGYVRSLTTYDEDIEAALDVMGHGRADRPERRLVLMGHSTGGLTVSLWTARNQERVAGLVLNSPWLEFQPRETVRKLMEPGIRVQSALVPRSQLVNLDRGLYARSISARFDGEWDYDVAWRPDAGWRATPAWLAAIFRGQDQVARGLGLDIPVLVLLSARSTIPTRWSEDMRSTDSVLDVVGIARRVPDVGSLVTLVRIAGGLHDVTLSAAPVREQVWRQTRRWFDGYVRG